MAPGQQRAAAHWHCIIQTMHALRFQEFLLNLKYIKKNLQIFQKQNYYTEWKLYAIVTIEILSFFLQVLLVLFSQLFQFHSLVTSNSPVSYFTPALAALLLCSTQFTTTCNIVEQSNRFSPRKPFWINTRRNKPKGSIFWTSYSTHSSVFIGVNK